MAGSWVSESGMSELGKEYFCRKATVLLRAGVSDVAGWGGEMKLAGLRGADVSGGPAVLPLPSLAVEG